MSLPPGFIDELRNRLSMAQVAGRKVMWDSRKSNPGKGDLWAPCPFHQEKTASFHVDDRKGYYYCFGCHAKGDMISFVRETENVGFMEAVEILAGEAGMPMPAPDPKARARQDLRGQLAEVMEMAVAHFRLQLKTGAGAAARSYLAGRGLDPAACDRWEIGFAPPGWQGLWEHLRAKGASEALILGAGLARASDKGRAPYDTFRDRILFPIRDPRGRCIAFGGRAMDPADGAKYLNSPETELFDKGRVLFNFGRAREAVGKGAPLIVAEGYMDVIALAEAGFGGAVAPLGTAITEAQLQLLWRASPEPIVALDGDRAGIEAGMRLMDLALPLIEPGQALRFCLMPDKQDPDDVIRAGGPAAMQALIEAARPMVDLMWRRETEGRVFDSPERRAGLDASLRKALKSIRDAGLRSHYAAAIAERRATLFGIQPAAPRPFAPWSKAPRTPQAAPGTRASALAAADAGPGERMREAVILATLVTHPGLVERFADPLERLDLTDPAHIRLRAALLRDPSRAALEAEIGAAVLESLLAPRHVQISPGVRNAADADQAALCLAEELAKLAARRGARREIAEALEEIDSREDESLTWRLAQAAAALNKANAGQTEDRTEYETAPNGAKLSREERARSRSVFDAIDFARTRRDPGAR